MSGPTPESALAGRPWPENAWPTAEQWLPWFLGQAPDEQLATAERFIEAAQEAAECFMQNHKHRLAAAEERVRVLREQVEAVQADMESEAVDLDGQKAFIAAENVRRFATDLRAALNEGGTP